jgi:glycosyltransferase involved in cell wall biosynthesis
MLLRENPGVTMRHAPGVNPLISIIVPCYNEGDAVEHFYGAIIEIFRSLPQLRFEVVFVDDGSEDDTLKKLKTIIARDGRFRVIELSRNFGKEAALTAAIDNARGDAIIPIDVDLQDPPQVIHKLIDEWLRGAEVVLARRVNRKSDSFLKRSTAAVFYRIHNRLSTTKIPEDVGDFRLMDRQVVDALGKLHERQRFMKGLFAWVGFKTVVVDYTRQARAAGTTKFSGWRLWNFAIEGITSFSAAPLKVWMYLGGIGALTTLSYALFMVIRTLVKGIDVPGYASLLVAVLFLGSLQLIGIGVLGEYIGRIYMEAKGRPTYVIRSKHESDVAASPSVEVRSDIHSESR